MVWAILGLPAKCKTVKHSRLKETEMPKLKTKSSVKKRFSRTGSGGLKHGHANKRHRLISKPKKMKRSARGTALVRACDFDTVNRFMPYN